MSQFTTSPWFRRSIEFFATAGYVGKIPFAPGTWGTLWGIPIAFALSFLGPLVYMGVALVLIAIAIVVSEFHERELMVKGGGHDSKEIVIDEVVGYVVAFTWLPANMLWLGLAFIVFRAFDILKPWPISWIDRKVKGGLGVVIDDVAAGLIANIILQTVLQYGWLQNGWLRDGVFH